MWQKYYCFVGGKNSFIFLMFFYFLQTMRNNTSFQYCSITHKIAEMAQPSFSNPQIWQWFSGPPATCMLPLATCLEVHVHQGPGYTKPQLPQVYTRSSGLLLLYFTTVYFLVSIIAAIFLIHFFINNFYYSEIWLISCHIY